ATGQDKVKKGFEPSVPGFRHVPYNDLEAMRAAISPATAAILVEGIQGEGGVTPATPEYLFGLRALCDDRKLLLLVDGVQDGHFLKHGLENLATKYPAMIRNVRGLGLMLGLELAPDLPNLPGDTNKTQAVRFANLLHAAGLLAIPAGTHVLRFLPPLNLRQ